ncbi:enoyl-CoA hydratase/isomerase family protein [Jatrophihabitans sp. YIM 134969]
MADDDLVHLELDGDADAPGGTVAVLRLDRPPMNALNSTMVAALRAHAEAIAVDPRIRAVVVHGGEKVFAAGADVKQFHTMGIAEMAAYADTLQNSLDALARLPKPVVAAITGFALGGGCELALTADFRVAADDARFGQPEILLGIIPGAGGTQRLPRLVGPAKAKNLIYTGRMIGAAEAQEIGLVDVVVPKAEVLETALELARQFVGGPAIALAAAKTAIDAGLESDLSSGLRLESALFTQTFGTADGAGGIASFVTNGPGKATFEGK